MPYPASAGRPTLRAVRGRLLRRRRRTAVLQDHRRVRPGGQGVAQGEIRDRLGRNVPEQRFDHYAGVGLHARGRTRIPRKTDGSRAERRRGCPDHPLLDGGQLQLLHGDGQVPCRTYAVGQHRKRLHGRLRPQNVHPRRDIGLEHHRLRPLREHAARYDRGDECIPRRRAFAGSAPVRYSLREPHGVLLAHRPQRATAAQERVPFRQRGRPRRRFLLHRKPHAEHRRTGMEALQGSGGTGRLYGRFPRRFHSRRREGFGRGEGQRRGHAPHRTPRHKPIP